MNEKEIVFLIINSGLSFLIGYFIVMIDNLLEEKKWVNILLMKQ